MKPRKEIEERKEILIKDKHTFIEFLKSIYKKDDFVEEKINEHIWKFEREIEILNWVLDEDDLPF